MSRLLTSLLALSTATFASAQSIVVDVPGVRIGTSAKGRILVEAANADVRINDVETQKAAPPSLQAKGSSTTLVDSAIVNAAGTDGRSVQVINGRPGDLATDGTTTIVNGAVVNSAGRGGLAEQIIDGKRTVVHGETPSRSTDARDSHPIPRDDNFVNDDLVDLDFSGRDLAGANFTNATLVRVNFSGANLRGANFTNAVLVDCNFDGAIVEAAAFTNAVLDSTTLQRVAR